MVAAILATVRLAGTRDVGAATLADRDTTKPHLTLVGSPTMLAARLMRPVALGWLFAILAFAVLIGTVPTLLLVLAGVIAGIGGVGRRGQPAPRGELRLATYRRPQHRAAITVPARPGHPGVRRLVPAHLDRRLWQPDLVGPPGVHRGSHPRQPLATGHVTAHLVLQP
jgi:hypothetical protein